MSSYTRSKLGNVPASFGYHLFSIVLGLVMIYPLLWMVSSSLKGNSEVFAEAGSLIPKQWLFNNYATGWKGFGGVMFGTFFANSFIISILATIGGVLSSTFVAYGFARISFKGKKFWFICMMLTMMLPSQVLMLPQYILFNSFHWIGTFLPLIVPYFFGVPFFIFMCMQFIQGIPAELDESAKMDGCNRYLTFWYIIMPLTKSAMVTSAIFSFYWRWEDFLGPLLYLNKVKLYPVSLAIKLFADPYSVTDWGAMFGMATLSLVPVFLIFLTLQSYIVKGISTTGLKG